MSRLIATSIGIIVIAVSVAKLRPHDEAALLTDWSEPPPWPLFIGLNMLAGMFRGLADALTPPPIKMLDMAMGYHTTMLVHTAQKFKIPDILADGPLSAAEIAEKIGSDAALVKRVMFACAANGVFQLSALHEPGTEPLFVNSMLSAVLRVDHPNSMRAMVGHNAEDAFTSWGKLADYLANPKGPIAHDMAWPQYPFAKGGIWAKFEALPESEEQFGKAMTSLDGLGANAMIADGPWAKFSRVVDVGGGRGHFLHRLLEAHPSLKGVLLDRPPVIELAKKAWGGSGEFSSAAARAQLKPGSFFEAGDVPPAQNGDAFYMRYILHDWPLQESLSILKNVRAALGGTNATLLIGECALPDHDTVGVPPVMYQIDIQMMVAFGGGAQERTPAQWKELLTQSGFELVTIHPTRSLVHWVEAKPV